MRQYATQAEYAAWPDAPAAPTNVDTLLRMASKVVDAILVTRSYDVDDAGLPTDADVTQSLADATCALVAEWVTMSSTTPGSTQQWESVAIGSVSLSNLQGASTADTPTVLGLPVPAVVQVLLSDVGTHSVCVQ